MPCTEACEWDGVNTAGPGQVAADEYAALVMASTELDERGEAGRRMETEMSDAHAGMQ